MVGLDRVGVAAGAAGPGYLTGAAAVFGYLLSSRAPATGTR